MSETWKIVLGVPCILALVYIVWVAIWVFIGGDDFL